MARKSKELTRNTYEALLDAAVEIFSHKGYSNSTFHEIAERAGLTRGAIYWHFTGKIELLDAALQRDQLPWAHLPVIFTPLQRVPSVVELCATLAQGFYEVVSNSRLQKVTHILLHCSGPEIAHTQAYLQFAAVLNRVNAYVVAVLSAQYHEADGAPHPDIQVAAASIKALVVGSLYSWLLNKSEIDLTQIPMTVEKLILSFFDGSQSAEETHR